MKRVLKSGLIFVICLNLILFSCLCVFADSISGSFGDDVQAWSVDMWKDKFPNTDFSKIKYSLSSDLDYNLLRQRVADFPNEFQVIIITPTSNSQPLFSNIINPCYLFGNAENYQDYYFNFPSGYSGSDLGKYYRFVNNQFELKNLSQIAGKYCYSISPSEFSNSSSKIVICNSLEWYNYMVELAGDASTDGLYYYDGNILQSFLDVVDSANYDDVLYDVSSNLGNHFIKFYDCFESYKGKYNYEFFKDDRFKNYLNSSFSFDDEIFYTSNVDTASSNVNYQHKEVLDFYVKINDEDNYNLSLRLNAQDSSKMTDSDIQSFITQYLIDHSTCKHFDKGTVPFTTIYTEINNYWFKGTAKFSLHKVSTGNHTNVATEFQYYIKFPMPNSYTLLDGSSVGGNVVFMGSRTVSNASLLSNNSLGIGSRIDEADNGDVKTRADLLRSGWRNGYPNKSDYPYYIRVLRNSEEFLYFYFKEKPQVKSYFYTDYQIKYTVDLTNMQGYIYHKNYNVSTDFDFSSSKINDLKSSRISFEDIVNAVELGSDISSLVVESSPYFPIVSFFFDIFKTFYSFDISAYSNLSLILWTNYVGQMSNGAGDMRGYLVQFNWDVGVDKAFVRDNSDDTHNYSDDVIHDIPTSQEMPTEVVTDTSGNIVNSYNSYTYNYYYSDNNGNVHGGGDQTYTPTEASTSVSELAYQSVTDFDFNAGTLWNYANSFMSFCKNAFLIFPPFIWLLIASGIVVVIALRLLGR